jgi:hypothetical protein
VSYNSETNKTKEEGEKKKKEREITSSGTVEFQSL